jgi:hypothetical protein
MSEYLDLARKARLSLLNKKDEPQDNFDTTSVNTVPENTSSTEQLKPTIFDEQRNEDGTAKPITIGQSIKTDDYRKGNTIEKNLISSGLSTSDAVKSFENLGKSAWDVAKIGGQSLVKSLADYAKRNNIFKDTATTISDTAKEVIDESSGNLKERYGTDTISNVAGSIGYSTASIAPYKAIETVTQKTTEAVLKATPLRAVAKPVSYVLGHVAGSAFTYNFLKDATAQDFSDRFIEEKKQQYIKEGKQWDDAVEVYWRTKVNDLANEYGTQEAIWETLDTFASAVTWVKRFKPIGTKIDNIGEAVRKTALGKTFENLAKEHGTKTAVQAIKRGALFAGDTAFEIASEGATQYFQNNLLYNNPLLKGTSLESDKKYEGLTGYLEAVQDVAKIVAIQNVIMGGGVHVLNKALDKRVERKYDKQTPERLEAINDVKDKIVSGQLDPQLSKQYVESKYKDIIFKDKDMALALKSAERVVDLATKKMAQDVVAGKLTKENIGEYYEQNALHRFGITPKVIEKVLGVTDKTEAERIDTVVKEKANKGLKQDALQVATFTVANNIDNPKKAVEAVLNNSYFRQVGINESDVDTIIKQANNLENTRIIQETASELDSGNTPLEELESTGLAKPQQINFDDIKNSFEQVVSNDSTDSRTRAVLKNVFNIAEQLNDETVRESLPDDVLANANYTVKHLITLAETGENTSEIIRVASDFNKGNFLVAPMATQEESEAINQNILQEENAPKVNTLENTKVADNAEISSESGNVNKAIQNVGAEQVKIESKYTPESENDFFIPIRKEETTKNESIKQELPEGIQVEEKTTPEGRELYSIKSEVFPQLQREFENKEEAINFVSQNLAEMATVRNEIDDKINKIIDNNYSGRLTIQTKQLNDGAEAYIYAEPKEDHLQVGGFILHPDGVREDVSTMQFASIQDFDKWVQTLNPSSARSTEIINGLRRLATEYLENPTFAPKFERFNKINEIANTIGGLEHFSKAVMAQLDNPNDLVDYLVNFLQTGIGSLIVNTNNGKYEIYMHHSNVFNEDEINISIQPEEGFHGGDIRVQTGMDEFAIVRELQSFLPNDIELLNQLINPLHLTASIAESVLTAKQKFNVALEKINEIISGNFTDIQNPIFEHDFLNNKIEIYISDDRKYLLKINDVESKRETLVGVLVSITSSLNDFGLKMNLLRGFTNRISPFTLRNFAYDGYQRLTNDILENNFRRILTNIATNQKVNINYTGIDNETYKAKYNPEDKQFYIEKDGTEVFSVKIDENNVFETLKRELIDNRSAIGFFGGNSIEPDTVALATREAFENFLKDTEQFYNLAVVSNTTLNADNTNNNIDYNNLDSGYGINLLEESARLYGLPQIMDFQSIPDNQKEKIKAKTIAEFFSNLADTTNNVRYNLVAPLREGMSLDEIVTAYNLNNDIVVARQEEQMITFKSPDYQMTGVFSKTIDGTWTGHMMGSNENTGFGQKVYLAFNTWLALNGEKSKATSLTEMNRIRRTETYLATALKTKITNFLNPSTYQAFTVTKTRTNNTYNHRFFVNDARNIYKAFEGMVSIAREKNILHHIDDYRYDIFSNTFYRKNHNTGGMTPLTEEEVKKDMRDFYTIMDGFRENGFTPTTTLRLIVFRSLKKLIEQGHADAVSKIGRFIKRKNIPLFSKTTRQNFSLLYSLDELMLGDAERKTSTFKSLGVTEKVTGLRDALLNDLRQNGIEFNENNIGDIEELTPTEGKYKKLTDFLSKQFGKELVFVYFPENFPISINGFTNTNNNTIYVNALTGKTIETIVGHELLHQIKKDNKVLYTKLIDQILPHLKDDAINTYIANKKLLNTERSQVLEEMVADVFGDRLADTEFWGLIKEKTDKNIFEKIIDVLRKIFSKIKTQGKLLSDKTEYFTNVSEAMKAVDDMFESYRLQSVYKKYDDINVTLTSKEVLDVQGDLLDILYERRRNKFPMSPKMLEQLVKNSIKLQHNLIKDGYKKPISEFAKEYKENGGDVSKILGEEKSIKYSLIGTYSKEPYTVISGEKAKESGTFGRTGGAETRRENRATVSYWYDIGKNKEYLFGHVDEYLHLANRDVFESTLDVNNIPPEILNDFRSDLQRISTATGKTFDRILLEMKAKYMFTDKQLDVFRDSIEYGDMPMDWLIHKSYDALVNSIPKMGVYTTLKEVKPDVIIKLPEPDYYAGEVIDKLPQMSTEAIPSHNFDFEGTKKLGEWLRNNPKELAEYETKIRNVFYNALRRFGIPVVENENFVGTFEGNVQPSTQTAIPLGVEVMDGEGNIFNFPYQIGTKEGNALLDLISAIYGKHAIQDGVGYHSQSKQADADGSNGLVLDTLSLGLNESEIAELYQELYKKYKNIAIIQSPTKRQVRIIDFDFEIPMQNLYNEIRNILAKNNKTLAIGRNAEYIVTNGNLIMNFDTGRYDLNNYNEVIANSLEILGGLDEGQIFRPSKTSRGHVDGGVQGINEKTSARDGKLNNVEGRENGRRGEQTVPVYSSEQRGGSPRDRWAEGNNPEQVQGGEQGGDVLYKQSFYDKARRLEQDLLSGISQIENEYRTKAGLQPRSEKANEVLAPKYSLEKDISIIGNQFKKENKPSFKVIDKLVKAKLNQYKAPRDLFNIKVILAKNILESPHYKFSKSQRGFLNFALNYDGDKNFIVKGNIGDVTFSNVGFNKYQNYGIGKEIHRHLFYSDVRKQPDLTLHEFASLPEIVASLHERDLIRINEVGHKEYRKKYNGKVIRIVISSNNEFISAFKDHTVENKIETHPFNGATASVLNGASLEYNIEYIGTNVNAELKYALEKIEDLYKENYGIQRATTLDKLKEWAKRIWDNRKHFQYIDYHKYGEIANKLRILEDAPERAKINAVNIINKITKDLTKEDTKLFHQYVFLKDIEESIEHGVYENKIPFYDNDFQTFKKDLEEVEKAVEKNERVKDAVDRRRTYIGALRDTLISNNFLDPSTAENDFYFRHQVLEYYENKQGLGLSSQDVRNRKQGWQRNRSGQTEKLYNTNYFEAEFEWLSTALSQLETKEIIKEIEKLDISQQLKRQAKAQSTEDNKVNWRDLIPEGYVEWRPVDTNIFYPTMTATERQITKILNNLMDVSELPTKFVRGKKPDGLVIPEGIAKTLDNFRNFEATNDTFTDHVHRASRGIMNLWKQYILLNPFRAFKYNVNNMTGDLDIVLAYNPKILTKTKKAVKELYDFYKEHKITDDLSKAIEQSIITTGITVQEIPDITELRYFEHLALYQNDPDGFIGKGKEKLKDMWEGYWKATKTVTVFRENVLRYATFLHFQEELRKGKKVYGASKKYMIDQIRNRDEKAGLLARNLLIDYGDVSSIGQYLRNHVIPFWSWLEKNAPRYFRLLMNTRYENNDLTKVAGRTFALAIKNTAWGATKLGIRANIIYGAIMLWNMLMYPDEYDELRDTQRDQLMLIIGHKTKDGYIPTLRLQGALSDALNWFALEDFWGDIADIKKGYSSVSDKFNEAKKAFIKKTLVGIQPFLKLGVELAMGASFYPDPTSPRPIKDKIQHASKLLSLDLIYRLLTDKPQRGLGKELFNSFFGYNLDADEAYYFKSREIVGKFKESKGEDKAFYGLNEKAINLNYFREALRYGDDEALMKYSKLILEANGNDINKTIQSLEKSISRYNPLSSLKKTEIKEFYDSLNPKDKMIVEKGVKWYRDLLMTYNTKKADVITNLKSTE